MTNKILKTLAVFGSIYASANLISNVYCAEIPKAEEESAPAETKQEQVVKPQIKKEYVEPSSNTAPATPYSVSPAGKITIPVLSPPAAEKKQPGIEISKYDNKIGLGLENDLDEKDSYPILEYSRNCGKNCAFTFGYGQKGFSPLETNVRKEGKRFDAVGKTVEDILKTEMSVALEKYFPVDKGFALVAGPVIYMNKTDSNKTIIESIIDKSGRVMATETDYPSNSYTTYCLKARLGFDVNYKKANFNVTANIGGGNSTLKIGAGYRF